MREKTRSSVATDEAIDVVLRDMVAKEAPPMLKARVLARLGDEVIDATLRNIAAQEVPATLRARVMARLDEQPNRIGRARDERWTLVQPLLRPALGLGAAGLVVATALTAWLLRTPPALGPESERTGQVASQLEGSGRSASPAPLPTQSPGGISGGKSRPAGAAASEVSARASRSERPPGVTRLARHATPWSGWKWEEAAPDADDPLAIRHLRVEPLAVSTIAIPPIEVAPVEIVPPMSDVAPSPPGQSGAESRTGG